MSSCANCHRVIDGEKVGGFYAGPFLFCSPMCRDTYQGAATVCPDCKQTCSRSEYHDCPANAEAARAEGEANRLALMRSQCGVPSCFVCSGAMRSRAGKGDSDA